MDLNGYTIVFDLDGTLVDTAPDLICATNYALEKYGYPAAPQATLKAAISHGIRRMLEVGLRGQSNTPADDGQVDLMTREFFSYYSENVAVGSKPYPGVRPVLQSLASQGAILAVCTNKLELLSRKLIRDLSMDQGFSAICGRDTFPFSKPHPEHLLRTVLAANGDVKHAVMVGDSEIDIRTARDAKIPIIAVSYGYPEAELATLNPDVLIDDFHELPQALALVLPAI